MFQTSATALTETHRLRVVKKMVLRKRLASKREEVTGDWKKLHNEELHDLYCSANIWMIGG
jgi:hypothetical protein